MTSSSIAIAESSRGASLLRRLRAYLPSFRLRTLLIFAVVFCVLFGWIGRGVHRVREEDAAMESLLRAGATIWLIEDSLNHPQLMGNTYDASFFDPKGERLARIVGWRKSPRIYSLSLNAPHPDDVTADDALAALLFFPDVEELSLSGEGFDDASIQELDILLRLKSLTLGYTRVTAEGLAAIPAPERIRMLRSAELGAAPNLLVGVSALTELRSLAIEHPTILQEEIDAVAAHPKLETLTLPIDRLASAGLFATLQRSESLRDLHVSLLDTAFFVPTSLPELHVPPSVERFSIDGIQSSELSQIAPGRDLRTFMLVDWNATDDAVRAFSAQNPDCQVQVWGWCLSGGPDAVYLAGRRVRPGTTEPLVQALAP